MRYALLVLAVLGGLYSLHRLALWAEREAGSTTATSVGTAERSETPFSKCRR